MAALATGSYQYVLEESIPEELFYICHAHLEVFQSNHFCLSISQSLIVNSDENAKSLILARSMTKLKSMERLRHMKQIMTVYTTCERKVALPSADSLVPKGLDKVEKFVDFFPKVIKSRGSCVTPCTTRV